MYISGFRGQGVWTRNGTHLSSFLFFRFPSLMCPPQGKADCDCLHISMEIPQKRHIHLTERGSPLFFHFSIFHFPHSPSPKSRSTQELNPVPQLLPPAPLLFTPKRNTPGGSITRVECQYPASQKALCTINFTLLFYFCFQNTHLQKTPINGI